MTQLAAAQLAVFLPAAFLLGASPGTNNLLAFVSASRAGWRRAAAGVLGRAAAWAILVALVSLGLDAVLRTSAVAFLIVKWLGVAYLLYLAWRCWRDETTLPAETPGAAELARREFLTLMGNPKAYLLLTAFLPQFVAPSAPVMPQLAGLGSILVEVAAAMLWISVGALAGAHALTPLRRRVVNRVSAALLGTAALALARTGRAA